MANPDISPPGGWWACRCAPENRSLGRISQRSSPSWARGSFYSGSISPGCLCCQECVLLPLAFGACGNWVVAVLRFGFCGFTEVAARWRWRWRHGVGGCGLLRATAGCGLRAAAGCGIQKWDVGCQQCIPHPSARPKSEVSRGRPAYNPLGRLGLGAYGGARVVGRPRGRPAPFCRPTGPLLFCFLPAPDRVVGPWQRALRPGIATGDR
jgi:hypothetical protein